MNYQILFYTQIIQNIWWILCSFLFYNPYEYQLFILSTSCLVIRFMLIVLKQRISQTIIQPILLLILNCLYTEANLRMPMNNPILNHSNSIMIIANYQHSNMNQKDNVLIISKLGFPIYSLLRTVSVAFIQSNYFILESCVIIFVFVSLTFKDELKKKKEETKQEQQQEQQEQHHILFSKFQTFCKNDSNKQSLQNSLKKSRTHCSIYQEKPDDLVNIPFFYNKPDNGESLKNSLHQMASLKKSYNKKFSIGSVDKNDQQLHTFFQNIINNIFSAGVVILNQNQKVTFMNNKCEKLLEQRGTDKVVECLRKIIIANALREDDDNPMTPLPPKQQATMNRATFERILKQHTSQNEFDVFDALLFPQKHLAQFYQNLSPNTEFEQRSSLSESVNETFMQRKDALIYEHILDNRGSSVKKLKLVIIPTFMTNAQQEQLSFPSQQKVQITTTKNVISSDPVQPILVIKIKNISKKHKIEQMNKEKEMHNSLLKSFSHELKTPLNSSQDMLLILKAQIKEQQLLAYVEVAHISILFLIHQINDILDYAAMQSNTFKYRFQIFKIEEIVDEIKYIYSYQLQTKKIDFKLKLDEKLMSSVVRSDKQRIMQVLVNLLNNSSKYTPEGGKIQLSVKVDDYPFIKIQVKDSGIGIGSEQLTNLKRVLTSSMGKSLHRSRIKKSLGLGLNISARIVEGLVSKNDGTLEINSNHQNRGTKICFFIENQISFRDDTLRNPMISEYTNKNNTQKQQMSYYEGSQCSQDLPLLRQFSENFRNDVQSPSKKSKTNKSKFFNLIAANQDSLIEMNDLNTYHIDLPKSPQYFRHKSVGNETISRFTKISYCQLCSKILIVDDIPFNQIALKALLQHYKIKVDQAYDGYQAISLVKKQQSNHCQFYALIFMDIEMPGINGFQATKEILEITLDQTSIVMCSAYDTEENFREGESVGMSEFLPKPVQQKDLERILKRFGFI